MILDKILKTKKEEVAQLMQTTSKAKLQKQIAGLVPCRHFKKALNAGDCNIIAEVKCASPSRGRLTENFHPVGLAVLYEQNGASAVSVLTDENFFADTKMICCRSDQKCNFRFCGKISSLTPSRSMRRGFSVPTRCC